VNILVEGWQVLLMQKGPAGQEIPLTNE